MSNDVRERPTGSSSNGALKGSPVNLIGVGLRWDMGGEFGLRKEERDSTDGRRLCSRLDDLLVEGGVGEVVPSPDLVLP